MKRIMAYLVIFTIIGIGNPANLKAGDRFTLDLEGGYVFATYNTVQVPSPLGTRFSLTDDFDIQEKMYYRLRLSYKLGNRHQLSVLYAPLTIKAEGTTPSIIQFQNTIFGQGERATGSYTFNSYRLTYRYKLVNKPKVDLWIGFTGKIRDAEISLETEGKFDNTTDLGFVPLLNLLLDWRWSDKWGLLLEADALASPGGEGRAEDVALNVYHRVSEKLRIRAGYRFVEGGADVEQVYNFAFLHFFHVGVQFSF